MNETHLILGSECIEEGDGSKHDHWLMSEEKIKKKKKRMNEVGGCFIGEPRTAIVGKLDCGSDPPQQRVQYCGRVQGKKKVRLCELQL